MREPSEMAEALKVHWAKTFTREHNDFLASVAFDFLDNWGKNIGHCTTVVVSETTLRGVLARARHCSTGPDGIPYKVWQAARDSGIVTLLLLSRHLQGGHKVPDELNKQLAVFVAKGIAPDDACDCSRTPEYTRPLALKNTDIKTITAAANFEVKHILTSEGAPVQRGFIPGRNPSNNIVHIDAAGRCFGLKATKTPHSMPPIALFDFMAAFPSVS